MEKNPNNTIDAAKRIYEAWDEALGAKDLDAAFALYAPDATIESPLVARLLGMEGGVVQGHQELRRFIELVFQRQPAARKRFRTGYFTDGAKLMWEYPPLRLTASKWILSR
jgi:ketosteroid isomerase-like protein